MRDQHKLAMRCLDVERAGGSVVTFLKECGFISPVATWQRLQLNELGRTTRTLKTGKEVSNMKTVITEDQKKKAIQMALDGQSPLPYLRACGSDAPDKMWYSIKQLVKKKDMALYEKLPKSLRSMTIETPESNQMKPVEIPGEKVKDDNFEMITIRSKATGNRYEYSTEYNLFSVRAHGDEMSLSLEDWKSLLDELPVVSVKLGVKL